MISVRRYATGTVRGEVFRADALDLLRSLQDGMADIVFLDPPFNLGKLYSTARPTLDRKTEGEYRTWLTDVLQESARVLADGGALFVYHLPRWAMRIGVDLETVGLDFRQWIAISMKNGFIRGRGLYPAHYALLMFTKGRPARFTRPKLEPATCRHCGRYVKDYGGYRSIIDERGVNLSDFWDDLSPVRHKARKHRPGNELPGTLFDRVITMSGAPGALYVDPFAGSGTGAVCAAEHRLKFIVGDIVASNCRIVCRRLDEFMLNRTHSHDKAVR